MRKRAFLLILCILMTAIQIPAVHAAGNVYYVDATNGSDTNVGSFEAPFKTLLAASRVVKAGDTCYIREGVYRETLNASVRATSENPVTYRAYENEEVVISGGDLVKDWEPYEGNIYKATLNTSRKADQSIVFADGQMCHEARWPNLNTGFIDIESYAVPETMSSTDTGEVAGETYTLTHTEIPQVTVGNAMIWYNTTTAYWARTEDITASSAGSVSFVSPTYQNMRPGADSLFYITRDLALLDAPNEWYLDESGTTKTLYLYAPNGVDPNTIEVEFKERDTVIELTNSSYVNIEGISVRGAGIATNENTTHCTLDNVDFECVDYLLRNGRDYCDANGVVIEGSYNVIKNSEIKNNYGDGITLNGNNNAVIKCKIHDVAYQHKGAAGITVNGTNQVVRGNEIYSLTRAAIGGTFTKSDISYNILSDALKLSRDGSALYLANNDYEGSQIHHNIIKDIEPGIGDLRAGIYCDGFASELIFYNNKVSNINSSDADRAYAAFVNTNATYNLFFNNTFDGKFTVKSGAGQEGVTVINNDFSVAPDNIADGEKGAILKNNAIAGDAATAMVIPGVSDGSFVGAGEFAAGTTADVDETYSENHLIPGVNTLKNSQFENDFEGWVKQSGNAEIVEQDSWTFGAIVTRKGDKAAMLLNGDSISQKVTGLKPNTSYTVNTFAQTKGHYYPATAVTEKTDTLKESNSNYTGIITNLTNGSYIKIPNVDFKNGGFDKIEFITTHITKDDVFTVKIDSLEGQQIASYIVPSTPSTLYWRVSQTDLTSVNGVKDVYIVFNNISQAKSVFGGFVLRDSNSADTAKVTVISDGNECDEAAIGTENTSFIPTNSLPIATAWSDAPTAVSIKTGNKGEIEVIYEKNSGANVLYLDTLAISESFDDEIASQQLKISNIRLVDVENNLLSSFDTQQANIVEFDTLNTSNSEKTIKAASYKKDGTEFESTAVVCKPGTQSLGLGIRVPGEYGQYIELNTDENTYRITLVDVGNQVCDDTDIYIKKLWLNSNNILKNGEENTVSMVIRNDGQQTAGKIIVAFYDQDERLCNTALIHNVSLTASSSTFANSLKVVPMADSKYGRVFIWEDNTMRPLTGIFTLQ